MKKPMKRFGRGVVASLLALVFGAGTAYAQLNAYVANLEDDTISVIDTATNTVTATVPVPGRPQGFYVDPVRLLGYVATHDSDTVTVIDLLTNTVIAVVPVGGNPFDIVVSANGDFAYAAIFETNAVTVIDTATNTVVTDVPVAGPLVTALAPDGSVWTAGNPGEVSVIDTATHTITSTFATGIPWLDVAFSPDGALAYLAGPLSGTGVLDVATQTVIATIPIGFGQVAIATTPDGAFVYVPGGTFSTDLFVIDTATNTTATTIPLAGGQGIAITPDGAFAYVSTFANNVEVIDTATNTVVATVPVGTLPFRIAIVDLNVTPQDQIAALVAEINGLVTGGALAPNKANPLLTKLDQVLDTLDGGQTTAACGQLGSFINQVNAYIGNGTLTAAQGQALVDATNALRADLGC